MGSYASVLQALGVRPGDRVAAQISKSAHAIYLYLATLQIGAVYLPLNPAYLAREAGYILNDASPHLFVHDSSAASDPAQLAHSLGVPQSISFGDGEGGAFCDHPAARDSAQNLAVCWADTPAALLYTSGTTGKPKGAVLTHANLSSNARTLHTAWGWRPGDVLLHSLPLFHVHGLFVALHGALLNGSLILLHPRFSTSRVIDDLPRATVFMGVPTFYTRLLSDSSLNAGVCRNMRLFTSGSAPLREETWYAFRDRTGHTILERYGMTEAGMICSNPLDGERVPGAVGPALDGISVRIADSTGATLGDGKVGILEVRGPNVCQGYWQNLAQTDAVMRSDGFLITGDIATRDPAGYVRILGRQSDLIISGGYNVYPKEIETCLDELEGVAESAVIGVPHPDLGEGVVAVIVRGQALHANEVIAHARATLADFKTPQKIEWIDALPRNTMGKVQKNQLRELYQDLFLSSTKP